MTEMIYALLLEFWWVGIIILFMLYIWWTRKQEEN